MVDDAATPGRAPEPGDGVERAVLLGWLAFHRDALAAKLAGLDAEQLTTAAVTPSNLTLLGLMRHLTEMERIYGSWAIGGTGDLQFVWGDYVDGGPEWDFDVEPSMVDDSVAQWEAERRATDDAIAAIQHLDEVGGGNRYSVRWNLQKLVGEYARHNGHADLIRERIDGATGE
jgi:hypothetical protein